MALFLGSFLLLLAPTAVSGFYITICETTTVKGCCTTQNNPVGRTVCQIGHDHVFHAYTSDGINGKVGIGTYFNGWTLFANGIGNWHVGMCGKYCDVTFTVAPYIGPNASEGWYFLKDQHVAPPPKARVPQQVGGSKTAARDVTTTAMPSQATKSSSLPVKTPLFVLQVCETKTTKKCCHIAGGDGTCIYEDDNTFQVAGIDESTLSGSVGINTYFNGWTMLVNGSGYWQVGMCGQDSDVVFTVTKMTSENYTHHRSDIIV